MDTTLQELINQGLILLITAIFAIVGAYLKKLITTKIDVTKYGFENDRVERILDNAVSFAEQKAKDYSRGKSANIASSKKLDFARNYINTVDKSVVEKYGTQLNSMIERKVAQKFGA